ncbi:MAG: sigma-70 family RNA polymerase sigma factor [Pirellulales bacterium]
MRTAWDSPVIGQQIRAARQGCRTSLGQLAATYRAYLLRIANEELGRTGLDARLGASDVVQETLLHASTRFDRFHGETGEELLRWLRKLLINNLTTAIRRHRLAQIRSDRLEVPLESGRIRSGDLQQTGSLGETPSRIVAREEELERLLAAIETLPPLWREIVLLRNFGQCSYEELGEFFGRSPEAARKLWNRAVAALGRRLAETQECAAP